MKHALGILLPILICAQVAIGQTQTIVLYPQENEEYKFSENSFTEYQATADVGLPHTKWLDGSSSDQIDVRVAFRYDLSSIPTYARIVGVTLSHIVGYGSDGENAFSTKFYNFRSADWNLPNNDETTAQSAWNGVDDGTNYGTIFHLHSGTSPENNVTEEFEYSQTDEISKDIEDSLSGISKSFIISYKFDQQYTDDNVYSVHLHHAVGEDYEEGDVTLTIEYILPNATYLNDFGYSDHSLYNEDFLVTPHLETNALQRDHGEADTWKTGEYWALEMHEHNGIPYDLDNDRSYNRDPKVWERTAFDTEDLPDPFPDEIWGDAHIDDYLRDYDFTAHFYRLVDNEFEMWDLAPANSHQFGTQRMTEHIDFTADGQTLQYEYAVNQKRNEKPEDWFDVTVPLVRDDFGDIHYFVGWEPYDGGMRENTTIDVQSNLVTTTIQPDLHHKSDGEGNNPYRACYVQFKAWAFEPLTSGIDLTNEASVSVDDFEEVETGVLSIPITVKKEVDYNGVKYYFVGWWDGVYGKEYDQAGETFVTRHLAINYYSGYQYREAMVAMYKAHLQSDNADPVTKTNSQRKIAIDSDGDHHMVYESAGYIWYTRSTNDGLDWSPEKIVSRYFDDGCVNPSIAVAQDGTLMDESDNEDIVIVYYDDNVDHPGVIVTTPSWGGSNPADNTELAIYPRLLFNSDRPITGDVPVPVIAIDPKHDTRSWMAIWNEDSDLRFTLGYDPNNPSLIQEDQVLLTGASVDPEYPSIAWIDPDVLVSPLGYTFYFTWKESGFIRFGEIYLTEIGGIPSIDQSTWDESSGVAVIETVHSPGSPQMTRMTPALGAPSITADNAYHPLSIGWINPYFAYVAYELENSQTATNWNPASVWPSVSGVVSPLRVYSRVATSIAAGSLPSSSYSSRFRVNERAADGIGTSFLISGWGSNTMVEYRTAQQTGGLLNPSVSVIDGYYAPRGKREFVRSAFQNGSWNISSARISRSYPSIRWHAEGLDPNLPVLSDQQTIRSVYTASGVDPLDWKLESSANALPKETVLEEQLYMRQLLAYEDNGLASIGICLPRWSDDVGNMSAINWAPEVDSAGADWHFPIPLRMKTASFNADGLDSLFYEREIYTVNADVFDDHEFEIQICDAESGEVLQKESLMMSDLPQDTAVYELTGIDISGIGDKDVYFTVGVSSSVDTSQIEIVEIFGILNLEDLEKARRQGVKPSSVTLSQNYPNPFNPSTEITYGIPQDGDVKLTVFDNLGREVATLVDGYKNAGTYTVQFNAEDLPSGMYLYRIETASGTLSRKMVLLK